MSVFSNLRISHKISALMVALILGFMVIGVTYYVEISIADESNTRQQLAATYEYDLLAANTLQQRWQSNNVSYSLSGDDKRLQAASQQWQQLGQAVKTLELQADELSLPAPWSDLNRQLENLSQQLAQAGSALETIGITSEEGVRAQLRANAATNIQRLENLNATAPAQTWRLLSLSTDNFVANLGSDNPSTLLAPINQYIEQINTAISNSEIPEQEQIALQESIAQYQKDLVVLATKANERNTSLRAADTTGASVNQIFTKLIDNAKQDRLATAAKATEQSKLLQAVVTGIIFLVAIGTAVGVYLLYKSIVFPLVHMQGVIRRLNKGKSNARVKVLSQDELGDLGNAFNKLLDERIQQLQEQSSENNQLNNSIISLIKALGMIAKKDLTIRVPVSPDITGTISDAVNLLTNETAKTLRQVRDISDKVNGVSNQLQEQSSVVSQFAENERKQILATSKALETLARAMADVAKRSEVADHSATQAIESTQAARRSVVETVSGIRTIRETIAETEKRMKRLGERSQEVSGIVNLINTIAERTHILALNASMHAASAGEAGKGFAVVADEVQRLAENARSSTDEIAAMVNNMRVETADTAKLMNTLISQVADGTRLAEEADDKMQNTETATVELVKNVKIIAKHANEQAEVAGRVKDRAAIIRAITEKTGQQLEEQRLHTESLRACADTLVERISVFSLPDDKESLPENVSAIQAAG